MLQIGDLVHPLSLFPIDCHIKWASDGVANCFFLNRLIIFEEPFTFAIHQHCVMAATGNTHMNNYYEKFISTRKFLR